jgi:MoaA/NifB/PqqE/SkfB family radical SAM enzyme
MKNNSFQFLLNIIKVRLGIARLPLFVSWAITSKCPYRCLYCSSWKKEIPELELEQIYKIIDDLSINGTRWISFTGGEPFLRKDIDKIIDKAIKKNIFVSVNSSGFGVEENKAILQKLNKLRLSLDGPAEIHNLIRGDAGAYERVIAAARYAKEAHLKMGFSTVISKLNLNAIDFLLQKADEFNCSIIFQPATPSILRIHASNPIALSSEERLRAIEYLIKRKKQGGRIANSFSGLRYLHQAYLGNPIKCWGGIAFFLVEPNGNFSICPHKKAELLVNCCNNDIKSCINDLPVSNNCQQCFSSARIEFNCIFSQKIEALSNYIISP